MLTGPPPKFHGTRDILSNSSQWHGAASGKRWPSDRGSASAESDGLAVSAVIEISLQEGHTPVRSNFSRLFLPPSDLPALRGGGRCRPHREGTACYQWDPRIGAHREPGHRSAKGGDGHLEGGHPDNTWAAARNGSRHKPEKYVMNDIGSSQVCFGDYGVTWPARPQWDSGHRLAESNGFPKLCCRGARA